MSFKSINEVYTHCYKKSFLFARSYVHDQMVAEDIATESILKIWQLIEDDGIEFSMPLLVTIIKNKALDHLKHLSVQASAKQKIENQHQRELNFRISSLNACNPENIFSTEILSILRKTILKLPKQTQIIFNLSRFGNLSQKEIAQKMSLSTKSVEYHISRALKALRLDLSDYLPLIIFFF